MSLALIAALPFLGALLPGLMIRAGRNACALAAGAVTALALLMIGLHIPAVLRGEVIRTRIDWLPQLGLNANFMLDGLGLLFALLILGIGLLIILYARFYLSRRTRWGSSTPVFCCSRARCWALSFLTTCCFCSFSGS
jgi:multicomponent K+:H+ antiporter subunit A